MYVNRREEEIEPGVPSPIQDFMLSDIDGVDVTDGVLEEPGPVLLLIVKNVGSASTHCLPAINTLATEANAKGWYFYGVTASPYDDIETFRHEHQTPFDFLQCDETTLKTVNRSNPGLMMLKSGSVIGQWHCNDIPSFAELDELAN